MRSDERVEELHRRMRILKKKRAQRVLMMEYMGAFAACVSLAVLSGFMISQLPAMSPQGVPGTMTGSVFGDGSVLGYIMVALVSVCLGITFTLFCVLLKKRMKKEEEENG